MIQEPIQTPMNILHQGGPVVNTACIEVVSGRLAAIFVDTATKYCEDGGHGGGSDGEPIEIVVMASDRALRTHPDHKAAEPTIIQFPDFPGWDLWSVLYGRYTIYITLIKPLTHDQENAED